MKRICGIAQATALAAMLALTTGWAVAGEQPSSNAYRMGSVMGWPSAVLSTDGRAYSGMAGELFPNVMQASVTAQREFRRALPSIINYSQTAHTQVSDDRLASSVCPSSMCGPNNKWVMWDTPFTVNETKKAEDGSLGYKQHLSGFATGISRMFGETSAVGLAVGYDARKIGGRDNYHLRERGDTFHAALYGGTAIAWFFVDAYAGYSRTWHRTENRVDYANGGRDVNKANFNDTVLSAGLKVSYVCILPNEWRITPSLGLDYSHVRLDSFGERSWSAATAGTSSALRVGKSTYNNWAMPIAVSVNRTFSNNWFCFGGPETLWTPEVRAAYVPQFGDNRADVTTRFQGDNRSWKAKGADIGSYGSVGAGLKIKLRDKFIFAVDYNYSFASKYQNHSLTGTYGVSF